MGLEVSFNYIDDFNVSWPVGSTDLVSSLDDHIRGVKNVFVNQFPNLGSVVITPTGAQFNYLAGTTPGTVVASKAVIADANKDVLGFRNVSATTATITTFNGTTINGTTGNVTTVNSATGNITNVNADNLTPRTANADLAISRNGTGDVTIDGDPVYGMVILDTPVQLISGVAVGAWTTVTNTALSTPGAKKAIIRMTLQDSRLGQNTVIQGYIRKTGSGLSANELTRILYDSEYSDSLTTVTGAAATVETVVNLDSSSRFDYYCSIVGSASFDYSRIVLVGYYT